VEIGPSSTKKISIAPRDFIKHNYKFEDIVGGDAEFNALKIIQLFNGENNAFLEIVSLNSAAALLVVGKETLLEVAYNKVKQHILSGAVLKTLEALKK
jgi:anthranilate phosphoribosyltransferase